ncbi:MAG TPA: DNA repair protein RadA [Clostridiaceae bacterium]|nr:DNA repair protein RadA [Clostridiaceae bacterium]
MAKAKTSWFCTDCGHESSGWLGRCPACGEWNTFAEADRVTRKTPGKAPRTWTGEERAEVKPLAEIDGMQASRFQCGLSELDTVLGGGFVRGSLILLGGEPGVGKSTLVLQVLGGLGESSLYVSGEESPAQIRLRADRLGIRADDINLLAATDLSRILDAVRERKPALVVIDSIQTLYDPAQSSAPGSVTQIREVTAQLLQLAKSTQSAVLLVGHVTKDGQLAGPRILEHMVDTVLYFEGEANGPYRIIRAHKNRFGATDELGIFEMTGTGLSPVASAADLFRLGRGTGVHGSAVTAVLEGTRPMLLEIQALMVPSVYTAPLRTTQGLDRSRLSMLLAVLEKQIHIGLLNQDAYVNVTGGIRIGEPSADLAVLAAVLSSVKEQPLFGPAVILGEVGLTGEIRRIGQPERRLAEAVRHGFQTVLLPAENKTEVRRGMADKMENIYYVNHLNEAIDLMFTT